MAYWMNAKFPSTCKECGDDIEEGDKIWYITGVGAFCGPCAPDDEFAPEEARARFNAKQEVRTKMRRL
jgi:hypothetical protein